MVAVNGARERERLIKRPGSSCAYLARYGSSGFLAGSWHTPRYPVADREDTCSSIPDRPPSRTAVRFSTEDEGVVVLACWTGTHYWPCASRCETVPRFCRPWNARSKGNGIDETGHIAAPVTAPTA